MTTATKPRDLSHYRSKQNDYRRMYGNLKKLGHEFAVDATGTKRRLMGLQRLGYSLTEIAREIGSTQQSLSVLLHERKRVYRTTERSIADVAERWGMRPATGRTAERTRQHAIRHNYPSLWAWDDVDINDPAATPIGARRK